MSNRTSNVSFRIDSELKRKADELFSELGINMTTAFNIFLRQSVRSAGIPFELKINQPNNETLKAINEGEKIIKEGKARFDTVDEMFADLGI